MTPDARKAPGRKSKIDELESSLRSTSARVDRIRIEIVLLMRELDEAVAEIRAALDDVRGAQ